jgi:hypothetical protein
MRCRNCGSQKHQTQHCDKYGPWYPAPGKTKDDYKEIADWISTLVAGDVLAEHEADHVLSMVSLPVTGISGAPDAQVHTLDDLKEMLRMDSLADRINEDLEPL